jgi:predicted outer membrane lipoprotein
MGTLVRFVVYLFIATCVIILAVILGAYGSWYFAWLIGTVMIVLIAAAGAVLLDTQEDERTRAGTGGGGHQHGEGASSSASQ